MTVETVPLAVNAISATRVLKREGQRYAVARAPAVGGRFRKPPRRGRRTTVAEPNTLATMRRPVAEPTEPPTPAHTAPHSMDSRRAAHLGKSLRATRGSGQRFAEMRARNGAADKLNAEPDRRALTSHIDQMSGSRTDGAREGHRTRSRRGRGEVRSPAPGGRADKNCGSVADTALPAASGPDLYAGRPAAGVKYQGEPPRLMPGE